MTDTDPRPWSDEDEPEPGPQLDLGLPTRAPVVHDLAVRFTSLYGLDYDLSCPNGPGSSCHRYRDEETGELVDDDECVIKPWFDWDRQAAVEGYAGPDRDSIVSGPINVLIANEDEFVWEYVS